MKRKLATAYAVVCTIAFLAGLTLVFFFAQKAGVWETVEALVGFAVSFAIAPVIHELGHVSFAQANGLRCTYVKCFCFRFQRSGGKTKFSFVSPFAAEQTQAFPTSGGNMQKRVARYTLGGLVFSGALLIAIIAAALICALLGAATYSLWGWIPYTAYLFLLNLPPFDYVSGKTDTLVYLGIRKGYDAESVMLSAMEIQGELYEGKSFAQIEDSYYFDVPQLCEDEPAFAVILDLRYRYYLEKGETEKARQTLDRLTQLLHYLSAETAQKIMAEKVYMRSTLKDVDGAEASGRVCREFLTSDEAAAKRALAAFCVACGREDEAELLIGQAEASLQREEFTGARKFEKILLSRLKKA